MIKKEWEDPQLEVLEVSETMWGPGPDGDGFAWDGPIGAGS